MQPLIKIPKVSTGLFSFGDAIQNNSVPLWLPNPDNEAGLPNPQRLAVESKADILGYGGAAGGGKTDLGLGLAAMHHKKSVILRRVFKNLRETIERSREIFEPEQTDRKYSFNESLHRWRLSGGRQVEFESCQHEKNKSDQRGRPRDLYVFDEVTEFSKSQFQFIIGWNRSTIQGQRCRVVMTFNPPVDDSGSWVIDYFMPWIAFLFPDQYSHPNPAAPGELRWFATIDGNETEVQSGDPLTTEQGETIKPLSRTFIPAKLDDNPHLANTNYRSVLNAMPEPLRSQLLYGNFAASATANPWQVIPTAWVKLAQQRWLNMEKPSTPLSGVGVDVARGGRDKLVISKRYGAWFAPVTAVPGVEVEDGPKAAAIIANDLENERGVVGYINIDVIGVGTSCYDSSKAMWPGIANAVNASKKSTYAVKERRNSQPILTMRNMRAEYHWRLREALDPSTGSGLALPPGNEIVSDLCAAQYTPAAGGVIQIESKDKIKARLGRSPDVGEAIMLAWLQPETGIDWSSIDGLGTIDDYDSVWS